jgi:hypothetical protein
VAAENPEGDEGGDATETVDENDQSAIDQLMA